MNTILLGFILNVGFYFFGMHPSVQKIDWTFYYFYLLVVNLFFLEKDQKKWPLEQKEAYNRYVFRSGIVTIFLYSIHFFLRFFTRNYIVYNITGCIVLLYMIIFTIIFFIKRNKY